MTTPSVKRNLANYPSATVGGRIVRHMPPGLAIRRNPHGGGTTIRRNEESFAARRKPWRACRQHGSNPIPVSNIHARNAIRTQHAST
jgi:hypothetical protein